MLRFWLVLSVVFGIADSSRAADSKLLQGMPATEAGPQFLLVIEQPRQLVEIVRNLGAYQSATESLPAVREFLESTNVRRFEQLVAYAERELKADWPTLLDQIAGKGIAIGTIVGPDQLPALMLMEGTRESTVAEAYELFLRIAAEEAARQGEAAPRKKEYRGVETTHLVDDLHTARIGTKIYLANREAALQAGIDTQVHRKPVPTLADNPGPAAARALIGGEPLAWLWVDFAKVKESKQAQDFFANSRKDLFQTLSAGATVDAFRRADFLAAGLIETPHGYAACLKLPVKRDELPDGFTVHVPQGPKAGSLPLLQPNGVIYSQSFHLDLGELWRNREVMINEQQRKPIEKGLADVSKFVPNTSIPELLEQSGPYHRIVVANRPEKLYAVEPTQRIPAFAYIMTGSQEAFGPAATASLRAAGLLASFRFKLNMNEEKHDGVSIVSYRFPEDGDFPGDEGNLRFNFVPSFAQVGDSLVLASQPGLLKDVMTELKKSPGKNSPAVWRGRVFAEGGSELVRANPDQAITATILSQGVGLDEGRKQVDRLVGWIKTLGEYELSLDHRADTFEMRLEWSIK